MRILTVDPGLATGIAIYDNTIDRKPQHDPELKAVASRTYDPYQTGYFIENGLSSGYFDLVVCESYIITKKTLEKTREYYSLELIGVCKYLTEKYGVDLVMQTPAEGLGFVKNITDDGVDEFGKLKRVGWYVTNDKGDHQNAARSHLLLYMVRNELFDVARLLEESTNG